MITTSISSGPANAATPAQSSAVQTPAALAAAAKPVAAKPPEEDTVTLSRTVQTTQPAAPAQVKRAPTAAQVRALSRQGQTAAQIATKLGLSLQSVQSYLGTAQQQAPSIK